MEQEGSVELVPVENENQASFMKKTAVSRRWILMDSSGEGNILDLDKYAIMRRVPINARDLRILDPMLSYPSTILARDKAIVLNLEHIKAIITTEEVLLRDPLDDNVVPIVEELQRKLPPSFGQGNGEDDDCPNTTNEIEAEDQNEFPFEFRALEVALEAICSFLDARTKELETATYPALDELASKVCLLEIEKYPGLCNVKIMQTVDYDTIRKSKIYDKFDILSMKRMISSRNLDRVRKLKSAMTRLSSRVQKVRDELENLLDDDEDMADLYLSRKSTSATSPASDHAVPNWCPYSPTLRSKLSRNSRASNLTVQSENDVEELEMLLEAYFMQIESTMNKLSTLREYIDDTEDYINIQLDNHRNQLIQLELFLSSGTVCSSVYSLVAAIFGMNIPYDWKEGHGYIFKWVVIITAVGCASLFMLIISFARHKGLVGS